MRATRDGVALVLAVVVLLALGTITASLLFTSTLTYRIARTGEEVARARVAAESAARSALATWETRRYRDLRIGEAVEVAGAGGDARAVVERLAGGLFLVRASAESAAGTRASVGLLVRGLDLRDLARAFPAALTTGAPVELGGNAVVEGGAGAAPPPPWTEAECTPRLSALATETFGLTPRPAYASVNESVLGGPFDPTEPLRLGPLGADEVRRLADRVEEGALSPRPAYDGAACDPTAPANWGAPLDPRGACGGEFPLVFAPGDVHLTGGTGQGILVVDGNFTMSGNARFYGAILVAGSVHIGGNAQLHGAVTAVSGRPVAVDGDARVTWGACPILRALDAAAGLNRPLSPGRRRWVPVF